MIGRVGVAVLLLLVAAKVVGASPSEDGDAARESRTPGPRGQVVVEEAESASRPETRRSRPTGIPSGARRARVIDHVDGDTLHVMAARDSAILRGGVDTTVRLLEIDTPESVDPGSPDQCFAAEASAALARMLPLGSRVWVAADRDLLDPYGRTLLYAWTADGRFVNLAMVRRGYAKAVLYEPNDAYIDVMRRAERRAREAERGLWGECRFFGQPLRFAGPGTSLTEGSRYATCADAVAAGHGNYVAGRDPEYDWYLDADGDGVTCEY